MSRKFSIGEKIAGIALLIVWIVAIFTDIAFVGSLLSSATVVILVSIFLGAGITALILPPLCERLALGKKPLVAIISFAFLAPLFLSAILLLNRAHSFSSVQEKVAVERVFSQTHYKSQRVGRRHYTRGAPYQVYYMQVSFATGKTKKIPLTRSRYTKLSQGDTVTVTVKKGLLGLYSADYSNVIFPDKPRKKKRLQGYSRPVYNVDSILSPTKSKHNEQ